MLNKKNILFTRGIYLEFSYFLHTSRVIFHLQFFPDNAVSGKQVETFEVLKKLKYGKPFGGDDATT